MLAGGAQLVPVVGVVEHFQGAHTPHGLAVLQKQVLHLQVAQLPASFLSCQQHCQGRVFLEADGVNGVHDHANGDIHSATCFFVSKL